MRSTAAPRRAPQPRLPPPAPPALSRPGGGGVPVLLAGLTAQAASASNLDDVVRLMNEFQSLHGAPLVLGGDAVAQLQPGPAHSAAVAPPAVDPCRSPRKGQKSSPRRTLQMMDAPALKGEACFVIRIVARVTATFAPAVAVTEWPPRTKQQTCAPRAKNTPHTLHTPHN